MSSTSSVIRVKLFGMCREWAPSGEVSVAVPAGTTVSALREILGRTLRGVAPERDLTPLRVCAFGTENRVLGEGDVVSGVAEIALLPPVCGG